MLSSHGLNVIESCAKCEHRDGRLFCDLGARTLRDLDLIKFATVYPKSARLFVEGQTARGVSIICSGRVKLLVSSSDAKVLITQIAEPGEVLGLAAVLAGTPHETSAEALDACQITFIRRDQFLRLLAEHHDASLRAAEQLHQNYRAALGRLRLVGLSNSAEVKFARFLLEHRNEGLGCRDSLKLTLTHEEIGQLIGASRETVTRLFTEFKRRRLIQVNGATLLLRDPDALEALASA